MVRLTSTFGSNIVNSATVAEMFDKPRLHASAAPIPSGAKIGYFYPTANPSNTVPNIGIAGYSPIGVGPLPINASDGEGIINDDFSILLGKHSLQAGAFYIFGIKNQNSGQATQGNFNFGGTYTGSGTADYLLGLHDGYNRPNADPHYTAHYRSTEFYVQDDWKATSALTINAGVRFFYYSPDWLTGPNHEASNFEFSLYNPAEALQVLQNGSFQTNPQGIPITASGTIANLQSGLVFNTTPGVPRGFYHQSTVHVATRVGFAFALDKRTSIYTGYGVGYSRVPFQIVAAFGQNPPGVTSENSISGILENPAVCLQANVPGPLALQLVNTNFRASQVQNYSLIVEHQLFQDAIFQIGYSGSQSRHLRAGTDQNQILPTSTLDLPTCLASGQSPSAVYDFDPCLNTNAISSDYIRPYKGYDELFDWVYSVNGNYNSLQSQLESDERASRQH